MTAPHTSDGDLSFVAEALPAFISEAQEQLASMEQLLLRLEDTPDDRDLLDALFRCAHTVKGSAGIFGLEPVVAFTHHVETLLDLLREGHVVLTPALSTLLLRCNDTIGHLVTQADDTPGDCAHRAALIAELQTYSGASTPAVAAAAPALPAAAPGIRRWHIRARFGSDTFRNGMDPLAIVRYLDRLGTVAQAMCDTTAIPALDQIEPESCYLQVTLTLQTDAGRDAIEGAFSFVRDDCLLQIDAEPTATAIAATIAAAPPVTATTAPPAKRRETPPEDGRFIRVQADRLDTVINLLGELVIAGAGASLLSRQARNSPLVEVHQQITRLIEEIRNGTLQLRMVPIGETFARFRRVVRDTASELEKDVALEIVGGETELDKSVVERIADPLMHLVRNALDHGLEIPAERIALGKPAQGRLTLSACHESGSILIRIDDDGRGVRRDKVLARAWERGLVERGTIPADADILKLLFAPGFSTAEAVTNLSGRGVGMDVVKRNIEALRGTVAIHSTEGAGSRIEIRLPLTLAIIDGFLVGVEGSKFIFPLDAVVEVIESRPTATPLDPRGRSVVELRGQVLPVLSLRKLYALDSPAPERSSVVVIQSGGQRYGVMVDQLLGQHQTVIKPLGRMFRSLRGMSGSSILGNGEVALIFDVASLSLLAAEQHDSPTRTTGDAGSRIQNPSTERQTP